jgi:hypothetical protein
VIDPPRIKHLGLEKYLSRGDYNSKFYESICLQESIIFTFDLLSVLEWKNPLGQ